MDTFRYTARRSSGCEGGSECTIRVENNQLNPDSKYFLISGSMNVEYMGQAKNQINSPYNSFGWVNYINNWDYDKTVSLTTSPTTQFIQIFAESVSTNEAVPLTATVFYGFNTSTKKSANSESYILVLGDSFIVDGQSANNQKVVKISQDRDVVISSDGEFRAIYVERA
jgi:hypothetical protein